VLKLRVNLLAKSYANITSLTLQMEIIPIFAIKNSTYQELSLKAFVLGPVFTLSACKSTSG
jgi:hypothetical protein